MEIYIFLLNKVCPSKNLFDVPLNKNLTDVTNYINIINEIENIYEKLDFIMSLINDETLEKINQGEL